MALEAGSATGISASSHVKHVLVDGTAGFLTGGLVDHLFSMVDARAPEDAKTTALLVAKVAAQMFTDFSLGYGLTSMLYPYGPTDDVTNGFAFMWTMFQASPNMRRDIQGLAQAYQAWIHGYMDSIIKDVHSSSS